MCLIYETFSINLVQADFLLDFCFKNLSFSATQLGRFDAYLIFLFVNITFFGLILSQPDFLLDFCFKNLGFSAAQLAHFDACLILYLSILLFLNHYYHHVFYNFNKFSWFYNDGNIFVITYFNAFNFIEWSDLNFNSHILFEVLSVNDFLGDFLMWLCKNLFIRINPNKCTIKIFFYCFLSFNSFVLFSVFFFFFPIFINFYC